MVIPDWLLTLAAWLYLRWRTFMELAGLALLVAAAALVHQALGLAAAGFGLMLFAAFGGRTR